MTITLRNIGTSNVSLLPTLSGLPADVDVAYDVLEVQLNHSAEQVVVLTFDAATGSTPGTSALSLVYQDSAFSITYNFDVVVVDREEVAVNSVQNRLLASPSSVSSLIIDVTNLGTSSDVYVLEWTTQSQGDWFEFTLSPTTFQLTSGSTQQVSIGVQERSAGAPSDGVVYTLRVVSTSNAEVSDMVNLTIQPVMAGVALTVLADVGEAKPGGSVYGCLLYTSPSPRDATLSRMPSSA